VPPFRCVGFSALNRHIFRLMRFLAYHMMIPHHSGLQNWKGSSGRNGVRVDPRSADCHISGLGFRAHNCRSFSFSVICADDLAFFRGLGSRRPYTPDSLLCFAFRSARRHDSTCTGMMSCLPCIGFSCGSILFLRCAWRVRKGRTRFLSFWGSLVGFSVLRVLDSFFRRNHRRERVLMRVP